MQVLESSLYSEDSSADGNGNRGSWKFLSEGQNNNEVLAKISMVWRLEAESVKTSEEVVALVVLV